MNHFAKMASEPRSTTAHPTYSLNQSLDNDSMELYPDIRQPIYMVALYSVAYGIIFLFALFGNIVVVAVVFRNRRMHNLTNLFIVNLAIADILVAVFCIPITLLDSLYNGKSWYVLHGPEVVKKSYFMLNSAEPEFLIVPK